MCSFMLFSFENVREKEHWPFKGPKICFQCFYIVPLFLTSSYPRQKKKKASGFLTFFKKCIPVGAAEGLKSLLNATSSSNFVCALHCVSV